MTKNQAHPSDLSIPTLSRKPKDLLPYPLKSSAMTLFSSSADWSMEHKNQIRVSYAWLTYLKLSLPFPTKMSRNLKMITLRHTLSPLNPSDIITGNASLQVHSHTQSAIKSYLSLSSAVLSSESFSCNGSKSVQIVQD